MSDLLTDRIARHTASDNTESDAVAVVDSTAAVTYPEFWTRTGRVAAALRGMRRVAVLPTSDIGSLVAITGAMRAGVSVVLLHRHLLPEQYRHTIALTDPGAVIAQRKQHARLQKWGPTGLLTTEELSEGDSSTPDTPSPQTELLVGITSGTTGAPKLFVRDQASWAATLDRSDATFRIDPGDRVSVPGTLDHTHFLYGALHALTRGATVDLREPRISLPDNATHLYSVPTIAWDIAAWDTARAQVEYPSVREVLSSAARWPQAGREALAQVLPNATLTHFYGASELSFVSYDRTSTDSTSTDSTSTDRTSTDCTGKLFDGVEVEVRDGIVHVRSDMLFSGYLTEPGSSREPDSSREPGSSREPHISGGPVDGWMTVGDRGRLDPDTGTATSTSTLTLFGRTSDTIVRAGLNVDLEPIEAALLAIPGVAEAAVVGLPSVRMGAEPAAAVVLVQGISLTTAQIRRQLRTTLPGPSVPVLIDITAKLPRTPRGKLDRQALGATLATVRTAPSTTNQIVSAPEPSPS